MSFHEVRFPTGISRGSSGGPERRTEIVVLGSGREERNARWADSRRRYNAGLGLRSLDDIHALIAFFEERQGQLHGFRWKDHADFKSCPPSFGITPGDQFLGIGDGVEAVFPLSKTYGDGLTAYTRAISKPVAGRVRVAVDGIEAAEGIAYAVDYALGRLEFLSGYIPTTGASVSAGFEFDVPVRFDTDRLEIDLGSFEHGSIPSIPVVEIRL